MCSLESPMVEPSAAPIVMTYEPRLTSSEIWSGRRFQSHLRREIAPRGSRLPGLSSRPRDHWTPGLSGPVHQGPTLLQGGLSPPLQQSILTLWIRPPRILRISPTCCLRSTVRSSGSVSRMGRCRSGSTVNAMAPRRSGDVRELVWLPHSRA